MHKLLESAGYANLEFKKHQRRIECNILFLGSVGMYRHIIFTRVSSDRILLDLCDSWLGRSFGKNIGCYSRTKGIIESLYLMAIYLRFRKKLILTYISEEDKNNDRFIFPKSDRYVIPNLSVNFHISKSYQKRFVFMGDSNYYPNRLAIRDLTKALREAKWSLPKILLFGGGWDTIANPRFYECMPFVSDTELYKHGQIHLVPTRPGYGIKNKLVIPMSLGLQVIATHSACRELNISPNVIIVDKVEDFPNQMLQMYRTDYSTLEIHSNPFVNDEKDKLISFLAKL